MKKYKKKINKEISRSERRKYLDTMMADMGISSLSEISSNEERKRWLKAIMPSKSLERSLKEMGYDMAGGKNKRSLGSRSVKIKEFSKIASTGDVQPDIALIQNTIGLPKYREIARFLFPNILSPIISAREWTGMSEAEDAAVVGTKLQAAKAAFRSAGISDDDILNMTSSMENIIENGVKVSRKALLENPLEDSMGIAEQFAPGDLQQSDLGRISAQLSALGIETAATPESVGSSIMQFKRNIAFSDESNMITGEVLGFLSAAAASGSVAAFIGERSERNARREAQRSANASATPAGLAELSNIILGPNLDYSRVQRDLMMAIVSLDGIIGDLGLQKISIHSLYRSDYDQARVMLSNYERMISPGVDRSVGVQAANNYLINLYGSAKGVPLTEIYQREDLSRREKINYAEDLVASWTKVGHGLGRAMDITSSKANSEAALEELKKEFDLTVKWESEPGPHHHVVVNGVSNRGSELLA